MICLHEAESWEANVCKSSLIVNIALDILLKRNQCTRGFFCIFLYTILLSFAPVFNDFVSRYSGDVHLLDLNFLLQ